VIIGQLIERRKAAPDQDLAVHANETLRQGIDRVVRTGDYIEAAINCAVKVKPGQVVQIQTG
jgi:hypothetical protein